GELIGQPDRLGERPPPRRHLDFSEKKTISDIREGDEVMVIGEVKKVSAPPPSRRRAPLKVEIYDGTSLLSLAFFNQPWRRKQLRVGTTVAAKGKVTRYGKTRQMVSPLIDVIKDAGEAIRIVPLYPATAEIHTAWLRRIIRSALDAYGPIDDPLPPPIRARHRLTDRTRALRAYHFPEAMGEVWEARRRLVFDELFTLQTGLAYRKRRIEQQVSGIAHDLEGGLAEKFVDALPFELTAAQRKSIEEISADLARPIPMHRLLQGEVGSGKTVVALFAALVAVQGGYQAAIMAPTEVLAGQHFLTITKLLEPLTGQDADAATSEGQVSLFGGGPEVVLLTGGVPAAGRRRALERITSGGAGIVVGTHALIQEGVEFSNLGLAVVDEQHRFGVHQRVALKQKAQDGADPDVLIMTATPIPRTLTLTLYGDLDVSVLDELPAGRKPVRTEVIDSSDRKLAYDIVRSEVAAGHQAYVIVPLVEESDKLEVASAEAEAARLATEVFPDLSVDKIHGRMRPALKEQVMHRFRSGEIDVLISTTVIEVGVDVPNATVMLIEDADRFGLSQLHQLRGRIGRGDAPSTCLLLTGVMDLPEEERRAARERLEAVAESTDGFELARRDLEIRGAGEIMGARQAGWSDLRLTNLLKDVEILKIARDEAFALVDADPGLEKHPLVRLEMEGRFADRLEWLFHS
ncbi:MAG: ATP-dependent DNA helicase RecG, partial [Actinomycetota bacterium]